MVKGVKKDHLISSFLDFLYIEKGLSKNTVYSYENDINSFSKWSLKYLGQPIKKLLKADVNQYVSFLFKQGLKSSSVNRKISTIKSFYIYLIKKKIIRSLFPLSSNNNIGGENNIINKTIKVS